MPTRRKSFVVGVGISKFEKPSHGSEKWEFTKMGTEAARSALIDAQISYRSVEAAVASYVYGDSTCGQCALYHLGLTGIPIFNVNNYCSSGSSAIMLGRTLIESGRNCVLVVGFEKVHELKMMFSDRESPISTHIEHARTTLGADMSLIRPDMAEFTSHLVKLFGFATQEYMRKNKKLTVDDLATIAFKNRKNGSQNPNATLQSVPKIESLKSDKAMLVPPLTIGMSARMADGGAAVVLCSEEFVLQNQLQDQAVEILAQHMVTDLPNSFGDSFMDLIGYSMAKKAARQCYHSTGLMAKDVQVFEVHDCFSSNELFMYEALGLVPEGNGPDLIRSAKWKKNSNNGDVCVLGNRWVVNPSGGILSKGHPIGATGIAQCCELVDQLRGRAGLRQVDGAKVALQHNYGIGGAAVCTLYRSYLPKSAL